MNKVNVVVGRKTNIQVSANTTAGIVSTNKNNVTLKSSPVGVGRLDSLGDVVATGEISGAVPVYDANSDKYVVQKLSLSDVTGDIDGGTF